MRLLLAAAIALTACSGGAPVSRGGSAAPAATLTPAPINVDDMMGLVQPQTVFVADVEKVSAITLLNHFTRYTIPTKGKAQVAASDASVAGPTPPNAASWLYVLDGLESGGPYRLRTFDVAGGTERATRTDVGSVAASHRALATAFDGRVLVLKTDGRRSWVDAYQAATLRPLGAVMEKPGCGDRLLASGTRVAIVCLATGEIAVDRLAGGGTAIVTDTIPDLAGVAMADDGALYVVTADRRLGVVLAGDGRLVGLQWPSEWTGTVLADTIAVARGSSSVVVAQLADDGAWLREFQSNNVSQRQSLRLSGRLAGAPQFGVLALYPFAYFTSGGDVRHVDLNSGLLETMTEVGQGATVVAVVSR